MANFPITEKPQFADTMEQVTAQDRAAPDTFNPRYQTLLDNDNYLRAQMARQDRTTVVTLPAGRLSAEAPYQQRVAVPGSWRPTTRSCTHTRRRTSRRMS